MELKSNIKKISEISAENPLKNVSALVKEINISFNSKNDEEEIIIILKALYLSYFNLLPEERNIINTIYDVLKPINYPELKLILQEKLISDPL